MPETTKVSGRSTLYSVRRPVGVFFICSNKAANDESAMLSRKVSTCTSPRLDDQRPPLLPRVAWLLTSLPGMPRNTPGITGSSTIFQPTCSRCDFTAPAKCCAFLRSENAGFLALLFFLERLHRRDRAVAEFAGDAAIIVSRPDQVGLDRQRARLPASRHRHRGSRHRPCLRPRRARVFRQAQAFRLRRWQQALPPVSARVSPPAWSRALPQAALGFAAGLASGLRRRLASGLAPGLGCCAAAGKARATANRHAIMGTRIEQALARFFRGTYMDSGD